MSEKKIKIIHIYKTTILPLEDIFKETEEFITIYGIYCFLKKDKFLGISCRLA